MRFAAGHHSDAARLSRELAELSREITERCAALFESARQGGPERNALSLRGSELKTLQAALAEQLPAAAGTDARAMRRVIEIQRRTLSLLDEMQRPEDVLARRAAARAAQSGIVTMHSVPGPTGEPLWVADAKAPPITPRAASPAPKPPDTPRQPPPQQSAAKSSQRNEAPRRGSKAPDDRFRIAKYLGPSSQLVAAVAVIGLLGATTVSLINPIMSHLRGPADPASATAANRPKPSERLSQSRAEDAAKTGSTGDAGGAAQTLATATMTPTGRAAAPPSPGFVAVVSTHSSYAGARETFVTLKQLYPGPLAATAPDIRNVKVLGGAERFELALLPALDKARADDLCRRLIALGHSTCLVKQNP